MQIKLLYVTVDGKRIAFSTVTDFCIQVSKSRSSKSSYRTVTVGKGADFPDLLESYKAIKVGDGTRKRILMAGKVVLVRGR